MEKSLVEMIKEMDFGIVVVYRLFKGGKLTSQTVCPKEDKILGQVEVFRPWKGTPQAFVNYGNYILNFLKGGNHVSF